MLENKFCSDIGSGTGTSYFNVLRFIEKYRDLVIFFGGTGTSNR